MYNFEKKIKQLLVKNEMTIENLAFQLKISAATLHNLFKKNNTNTDMLKKIADVFNVPISYFFDDSEGEEIKATNVQVANGNNNKQIVSYKNEKIEELQKQIENLEKLLQAKDEIINLLKNK